MGPHKNENITNKSRRWKAKRQEEDCSLMKEKLFLLFLSLSRHHLPAPGLFTHLGALQSFPLAIFFFFFFFLEALGFPGGSDGKESACNVVDLGSIPGLGRSPGKGKGYLLHPVCWPREFHGLVHGVAESDTTEQLSLHFTLGHYYNIIFTLILQTIKLDQRGCMPSSKLPR